MHLNLKNYKAVLPAALLKQAEKNTVRECDETEKGNFIAYVDEGADSFDVALKISVHGEIAAHSCDCKNGNNFCRHRAALLLHIAEAKKIKQGVKSKKQVNAFENILEEAAPDKLREWIKELLMQNKDLALAFTHYFTTAERAYTPKEIEQITVDAIKAVVKNKKNIDPTELKKIISLWQSMHAPVIKAYSENVSDENQFLNFHAVIESCLKFDAAINSASNKIIRYIENLLQQQTEIINNLYNEEAWQRAVECFIKHLHKDLHAVNLHYLLHLKNLISVSNEERRTTLIEMLIHQYDKTFPERLLNGDAYTNVLFDIAEQNNLVNKYYAVFKPIRYDNNYNKKLIDIIIDNKNYKLAEKYCLQQIENNSSDEYNILYRLLLRKIYRFTNDETKLANVLTMLLPYTFDFDDFLFIYNRMTDEEAKKKWRTKMLTKSKHTYGRNKAAGEFCFKLMDYEKKYKKMIEYIDSYTSYETILRYFEPMALSDKANLLATIIEKSDERIFFMYGNGNNEKDSDCFPDLLNEILKHYQKEYLKLAIKRKESGHSWFKSLNHFTTYMKKQLFEEKE